MIPSHRRDVRDKPREPRLVLTAEELNALGSDESAGMVPVSARAVAELRRKSRIDIEQNWVDRFGRSYDVLLKTPELELGLYRHNGMIVICTPTLLMLDFDVEDKLEAVRLLQRQVAALETATHTRLRFEIYETDGGIHAFLTSHEADARSDNTLALMLQLQSDKTYAGFTLFRGFCARLNPKITDPHNNHALRTVEEIRDAVVARECYRDVCAVGAGRALPHLQRILAFKLDAIATLKQMYARGYHSFAERGSAVPTDTFVKRVMIELRLLLAKHGLSNGVTSGHAPTSVVRYHVSDVAGDGDGGKKHSLHADMDSKSMESKYVTVGGVKGHSYYTDYNRVLAPDDLLACRTASTAKIAHMRSALTASIDRSSIQYLVPPPPPGQSLAEAPYKMVLGFDPERCMAFLVLGDVLTIDWDFTDTMKRPQVVSLVRQFLTNLQLFEDEEDKAAREALQFRSRPLAFRMYETDNGIHAFCTSHTFPHSGADATRIMLAMCCDPAYIAFTQLRGYSLRLTPKVTKRENKRYVIDPEYPRHQFVQRPLAVNADGSNLIAGAGAVENQGIVDVVDMVYRIQRRLLGIPKLEEQLQKRSASVLTLIKAIATTAYDDLLGDVALYPRRLRATAKALHAGCDPRVCSFVSWPSSGALILSAAQQARHPCGCGTDGADGAVRGPTPHTEFVKWHKQRTLKSMPKW
jgi:hypothetical protein